MKGDDNKIMKMIDQSFEILHKPDQTDHDEVLKYLERIGRTCYKSESKITDDSAVKYLKMLRDRKHWAMLEHYIFSINIPYSFYKAINEFYSFNPKFDFTKITPYFDKNDGTKYLLSASATSINYLVETRPCPKEMLIIHAFMHNKYPELFTDPLTDIKEAEDLYLPRNLKKVRVPSCNTMDSMRFDWISVRFITNLQISHELVRHRICSFAQESSRYVNYSKGNNTRELTFIKPFNIDDNYMTIWKAAMENIESAYFMMTDLGCSAQEAAQVLPKAAKTEIVITARMDEWNHIFDMRADRPAHPQMKALMYPLLKAFYWKYQCYFINQKLRILEGENDGWIKTE